VHGRVGVPDEGIRGLPVLGEQADADAGREHDFTVIDDERKTQAFDGPLRQDVHIGGARQVGEQDEVFVAAQPRHRVAFTQQPAQALAPLGEEAVAHGVAEAVVHHLEAVQVDVQHRHLAAGAPRRRQCLLDAVADDVSIGQAGQAVVGSQVLDARLVLLALGGFLEKHRDALGRGRDALLEPALPRHKEGLGLPRGALGQHAPVVKLEGRALGLGEHIEVWAVQHGVRIAADDFGRARIDVADAVVAVDGHEAHGHAFQDAAKARLGLAQVFHGQGALTKPARAGDGNGSGMGSHFDQAAVLHRGLGAGAEVQGKRPQHLATGIEDGDGPAGPQAVGESGLAVIVPQRIGFDVHHQHRPFQVRGGAAGPGALADRAAVDGADVGKRQTGGGAVAQARAVVVQQQHRGNQVRRFSLNHAHQLVEGPRQRRIPGDHLQDANLPG
jgi:hypothetical protein